MRFLAITILALVCGSGCTPGPDKVCAKMSEVLATETKDWSDDDKKFLAPRVRSLKEECPKMAAAALEKDPSRYKKAAACVMAATKIDQATACDLFGKK